MSEGRVSAPVQRCSWPPAICTSCELATACGYDSLRAVRRPNSSMPSGRRGSRSRRSVSCCSGCLHDNGQHPTADVAVRTRPAMRCRASRCARCTRRSPTSPPWASSSQVTFGSGPARFDPNVADHHHAVCDECGAITDVYVDGADQLAIDGLAGFRPDSVSIVFRGSCAFVPAAVINSPNQQHSNGGAINARSQRHQDP